MPNREYGGPGKSEYSVIIVDAYNGINAYLDECSGTHIKTLEDVAAYNEANSGTEGASHGDHAAFDSGQACSTEKRIFITANAFRIASGIASNLKGLKTRYIHKHSSISA